MPIISTIQTIVIINHFHVFFPNANPVHHEKEHPGFARTDWSPKFGTNARLIPVKFNRFARPRKQRVLNISESSAVSMGNHYPNWWW